MRRRFAAIAGLELYALLLTLPHLRAGVTTDEAAYLLNIPSPHPPLARSLFGLLDGWAGQEIFWRIALATLLVQAVWLLLASARDLRRSSRIALALAWLTSAAVVLQAGTVTMAPLTALQGMLFVWLHDRRRTQEEAPQGVGGIGLLWLASLCTAYQAVLFAPVVWGCMGRTQHRTRGRVRLVVFLIPLVLLALYTLTNPLVPASMIAQGTMAEAETLVDRLRGTGWILLLAGSGMLSVTGVIGLLLARRWMPLLSFLLIASSVFLVPSDSSAILFLPLLIVGTADLLRRLPSLAWPIGVLTPLCTVALLWSVPALLPQRGVDPPVVLRILAAPAGAGDLLIAGSFGHRWQYASIWPVRRYAARFLSDAVGVVCLTPCAEMRQQARWERVAAEPVEVWAPVRR